MESSRIIPGDRLIRIFTVAFNLFLAAGQSLSLYKATVKIRRNPSPGLSDWKPKMYISLIPSFNFL